MNRLKSLLHVTVGFFAAVGVLSATQGRLAHALPGATSPSTLVADVNALKIQVAQLQTQVALSERHPRSRPPGTRRSTRPQG